MPCPVQQDDTVDVARYAQPVRIDGLRPLVRVKNCPQAVMADTCRFDAKPCDYLANKTICFLCDLIDWQAIDGLRIFACDLYL
jgi:hypothetical protein